MIGMLYVCGTPIGNLEDMTFRAIETLKSVDLIAAEDTRHSQKLLNHFEIKTPMTSYHEHNAIDKGKELMSYMLNGKCIALITDAGMPAISDPGQLLVALCNKNGVKVCAVPSATAITTAISVSGIDCKKFSFLGFLPQNKNERLKLLNDFAASEFAFAIYEAPHRIKKTISDLFSVLGTREVSISRELTKKFEETLNLSLPDAIAHFDQNEPKGEFVIVVSGRTERELVEDERRKFEHLSIFQHVEMYLEQGIDKKSALKLVAKDRGTSKSVIYKGFLDGANDACDKAVVSE